MLCSVCIDEIYDGDDIKCVTCKEYLHFTCAGFREATFRKLSVISKEKFSCPNCKTSGITGTTKSKAENNFVGSNETLANLATSVEFMSSKFDDFGKQLGEMLKTIKELKDENKMLKESNHKLKSDVNTLALRVNLFEQKLITNHIEIVGVPDNKNENCVKIVEDIASKLGKQVSVVKAYRIRSRIPDKPMKIVAELMSTDQKTDLMELSKKKKIRSNNINENWGSAGIFINNYLTKYNSNLFYKARNFAKEKHFKYVWFKDCKIFIKKNETSQSLIINEEADLLKIR